MVDIITATASNSSHVKVFSGSALTVIQSFFAFDPGFAGGVYVAAGDINSDGASDILTAVGPGAGPHVKVFSGSNGDVLHSFFAYGPNFTGGVRVAAADLNRDGIADIITATATNSSHVKVFDGNTLNVIGSYFADAPSFAGGVFVAAAPRACNADIAPLPFGDSKVDVLDLLAVINDWGPCGNPLDCHADIAPFGPTQIGDGEVNVLDLLAIINAWGRCP